MKTYIQLAGKNYQVITYKKQRLLFTESGWIDGEIFINELKSNEDWDALCDLAKLGFKTAPLIESYETLFD